MAKPPACPRLLTGLVRGALAFDPVAIYRKGRLGAGRLRHREVDESFSASTKKSLHQAAEAAGGQVAQVHVNPYDDIGA